MRFREQLLGDPPPTTWDSSYTAFAPQERSGATVPCSEHLQIRVRVTANVRKVEVSRTGESDFQVKVDVRASEGKANRR